MVSMKIFPWKLKKKKFAKASKFLKISAMWKIYLCQYKFCESAETNKIVLTLMQNETRCPNGGGGREGGGEDSSGLNIKENSQRKVYTEHSRKGLGQNGPSYTLSQKHSKSPHENRVCH